MSCIKSEAPPAGAATGFNAPEVMFPRAPAPVPQAPDSASTPRS